VYVVNGLPSFHSDYQLPVIEANVGLSVSEKMTLTSEAEGRSIAVRPAELIRLGFVA